MAAVAFVVSGCSGGGRGRSLVSSNSDAGAPVLGGPGGSDQGGGAAGAAADAAGTSVSGTSGQGGAAGGLPGGNAGGASGGNAVARPSLDLGRSTLRRLSSREYNNTVRDLLGTSLSPGGTFPSDEIYLDFDRVGVYLVFSGFLFEMLEQAANRLVDELFGRAPGDPVRARILTCEPTAATLASCATEILTPFMKRAYRRPVSAAEVQDRVSLAVEIAAPSGDAMDGLSAALTSVLLSPHFLFLMESLDPTSTQAQPLEDHEVASRLSYFLWSTMPDDELMAAADNRGLTSPGQAGLDVQIARMMADPKSRALVDDFAGQWLGLEGLASVSPDAAIFGAAFDESLRDAMGMESRLFFASLINESQPLDRLLTADYTFVNDRLAKHYGLSNAPATSGFTRVSLAGTPRRGFLTDATFLSVTSLPDRTGPPRRGAYVLERILCQPPPPPPPGVAVLNPPLGVGLTARQQIEMATASGTCSECHKLLNPLGFALDGFDAIGAYRTEREGLPIDVSVTLPDGTVAKGAQDLADWLGKNPQSTRCMVEHALTYAVGRPFDTAEGGVYVSGLADPMRGTGTWPALFKAVARSEAFLTNRGEGP